MKNQMVETSMKVSTKLLSGYRHTLLTSILVGNQLIKLTTSSCNYGGKRYWYLCPKCQVRVGVLYRPLGDNSFECRNCKNLKYELTQLRRSKNEYWVKALHQAKRF